MSRSLRVVAFTPGHGEVGGAARRSRLLCEELVRRGAQVRVVTRSGTTRRPSVRREPGLVVVDVPSCGGTRRGALAFLLVAHVLGLWWGRRADVLLSVQLASPTTAAASVGLLTRRPFVAMTTTSGALSEATHVMTASWSGRLRRRLLARAACIVAQTPEGAVELRQVLPAARTAVLPTPVEAVDAAPLTGSVSVLYAGRFSQEKQLDVLLQAWRQVLAALPQARLVLAGEGGAYRSVAEQLRTTVDASPELRSSVELPGWVADVGSLLRRHDVYVFPSASEGMSNSLVEACAAGRAVVASDIAPNLAVLGNDYPLLFPVGDEDALAGALLRALQDPAARDRAAGAAARRARGMLLSVVGADLEGVLWNAADRSRPEHAGGSGRG